MRIALLTCALACVAVSAAADGEDEDLPPDEETAENLQPVTWKYTAHVTNPETLFAKPDDACKQWAAFQVTKGAHHSFVKVVPSPDAGWEGSYDCVFKDQDWNNQQWTQSHGAEDVPTCAVTSEVISVDNSGTDASQRCRCTDVTQCATTPVAPAEDAKPPAEPPAPDAVPEYPFAPDKSKRCKQQKHKRRANARTAARTSEANRRAVQDDPEHAKWATRYNQVLERIERSQRPKQQTRHGANATAFPDFAESTCDNGGVTDVNIGVLCGSYAGDFAAANNVAGYSTTPKDRDGPCTWHHHEELGRMVLVKQSDHAANKHWGGVSIWKRTFRLSSYPK